MKRGVMVLVFATCLLCGFCLPLKGQLTTDKRHPFRAGMAFSFTSEEQPGFTGLVEIPLGKAFSVLGEAGGFAMRYLSLWRENPANAPNLYEGRGMVHGQFRFFPLYRRVGIQKVFIALASGYELNHLSFDLTQHPKELERVYQLKTGPGWVQPLGDLFYCEFQGMAGLSVVDQEIYSDNPRSQVLESESTFARFEVTLRLSLGLQVFDRKR